MKQAPTGRLPASAGVSDHHPSAGVGWRRGSRPATLPVSACLIRRQSRPFPAGRHAVARSQRRPAARGICQRRPATHGPSPASTDQRRTCRPSPASGRHTIVRYRHPPSCDGACRRPTSPLCAGISRHQAGAPAASHRIPGGVPPAPTGTRRHSGGVPPDSRRRPAGTDRHSPAIAGIRPAHNRPLPAPTVLRRCLPASHLALVCRHQPASGRRSGGVPAASRRHRPASGRHPAGFPASTGTDRHPAASRRHPAGTPAASRRISAGIRRPSPASGRHPGCVPAASRRHPPAIAGFPAAFPLHVVAVFVVLPFK